jgi:hypothetical protein
MSPIESRKRPPIDRGRQPRYGEAPIFRLPLPPTGQIVRCALPLFVHALGVGVGMVVLANLYRALPFLVASLLGAAVLVNLVAAALRYVAPNAPVPEALRVIVTLAVCGIALAWHDRLWPDDSSVNAPLLSVVVALVALGALGPFLVRGRTAFGALGWAGVFSATLIALQLAYVLSWKAATCLLVVPVVGLNLALAWYLGADYARYHLADPLLTHAQATRGERVRQKYYDWQQGFPAALLAVLGAWLAVLLVFVGAWEGIPRIEPTATPFARETIGLSVAVLCVGLGPVVYLVAGLLGICRPSLAHSWNAHRVWFGYDTAAAAGAGTFAYAGILASPDTRRTIYGVVLVINVLTLRLMWSWVDVRIDELTAPLDMPGAVRWGSYALTFITPLSAPLGLCAGLHAKGMTAIRQAIAKEADHA